MSRAIKFDHHTESCRQGQQVLSDPNKFTSLMLDLCLGSSQIENVRRYIAAQEKHHGKAVLRRGVLGGAVGQADL